MVRSVSMSSRDFKVFQSVKGQKKCHSVAIARFQKIVFHNGGVNLFLINNEDLINRAKYPENSKSNKSEIKLLRQLIIGLFSLLILKHLHLNSCF